MHKEELSAAVIMQGVWSAGNLCRLALEICMQLLSIKAQLVVYVCIDIA